MSFHFYDVPVQVYLIKSTVREFLESTPPSTDTLDWPFILHLDRNSQSATQNATEQQCG